MPEMMVRMNNLIKAGVLSALLLTGCKNMDLRIAGKEDLERRLRETERVISQRRDESNSMSLDNKAVHFEQDLYDNFKVESYMLFAGGISNEKSTARRRDVAKEVSLEKSISFLSALAFKYSVTKDEKTRKDTIAMLDSIYELDKANGLDGYLPFSAKVEDGKLKITNNHTHSNVYDQLMFAYSNVFNCFDDKEIRERISKHTKLVVSHFLNNNYAFRDSVDGKLTEETNAKIKGLTARSNNTSGIMLIESGLHMIQDDELKGRLLREREDFKENYPAINNTGKIRIKLLALEFPTHSTLWLHTQTLHTLATLTGEKLYIDAIARMQKDYSEQENPLLNAVYLNTNPVSNFERLSLISRMKSFLQGFPLTKDSREIINSLRKDIVLAHPRYIKFKHEYESEKPLPVYMRPGEPDFLKTNQQKIDGNIGRDNSARFPPIDYLLQYWFTRHLETKN
jgi:hypothetical protein